MADVLGRPRCLRRERLHLGGNDREPRPASPGRAASIRVEREQVGLGRCRRSGRRQTRSSRPSPTRADGAFPPCPCAAAPRAIRRCWWPGGGLGDRRGQLFGCPRHGVAVVYVSAAPGRHPGIGFGPRRQLPSRDAVSPRARTSALRTSRRSWITLPKSPTASTSSLLRLRICRI